MTNKVKPHKAIIHLNASEEFKNNPESMKMLNQMVETAYHNTPSYEMSNQDKRRRGGFGTGTAH